MRDRWWAGMEVDQLQLLPRLRGMLAEHTGLIFPPERWSSIERAIEAVGKEQSFADARSWLEWFTAAPPTLRHLQRLVSHLTIGETYFFRDAALFTALREMIFPQLFEARRNGGRYLRMWSAGCSTGEEPYSIAIALQRMLPSWQSWRVTLLATDINPTSLAKARAGIYDNWSFRAELPMPHATDFKKTATGSFEVASAIKDRVRFSQLNLAAASYPSTTTDFHNMDIIFCRNVLMYLEPACAQAIIDRFCRTLVDGGWLILSAVEAPLVDVPELTAVRLHDLILFKKTKRPQAAVEIREPIAPSAALSTIVSHPSPIPRAASTAKQSRAKKIVAAPAAVCIDANSVGANPAVSALIERARADANRGQLAAALDYCNQAIAIDKLNPTWTDLLAFILLEQNEQAAAEAALKRTLYLDQNRVLTHINLGNLILQYPARRAEAQRHFRTALEILAGAAEQDVLPETDGITAGQLREMIRTTLAYEISA